MKAVPKKNKSALTPPQPSTVVSYVFLSIYLLKLPQYSVEKCSFGFWHPSDRWPDGMGQAW